MKLKVAVFSIATNIYFDYWLRMYETASKNLFIDAEVTFHLFSNIKPTIHQLEFMGKKVVIHEIADLRWPEATLNRYDLMVQNMSNIDADVIVYLDADMLINEKVELSSIFDAKVDAVVLVRHPGYWRPTFQSDRTFYLRHFDLAIKDLFMWIKLGGIGTWERDKRSLAFVKRSMRSRYYCGGFWLGNKKSIMNFAKLMSHNVSADHKNGVTAIWHDESHLNSWATSNVFRSLSPSYCYADEYKNLEKVPRIITAVAKSTFTR